MINFLKSLLGPFIRTLDDYSIYPRYKNIGSRARFFEVYKSSNPIQLFNRSLDLGCGDVPRNPLEAQESYGIDIRSYPHLDNILQADLSYESIPFADAYFDVVTAYDFLEHIPRHSSLSLNNLSASPFINVMNDIHRVLTPGGLFFSCTPAFPSKRAFQDPTHVNIITEDTFPVYFSHHGRQNAYEPLARMYGFQGDFKLIRQNWYRKGWLLTLMKKI